MTLITNILTIYNWGVVCVLLYFLFSIAQFYEKKSGRRSYYPAYLVIILLFGIATVRYTTLAPIIMGDALADSLRIIGGVLLGGFGIFLLNLMMGGRS